MESNYCHPWRHIAKKSQVTQESSTDLVSRKSVSVLDNIFKCAVLSTENRIEIYKINMRRKIVVPLLNKIIRTEKYETRPKLKEFSKIAIFLKYLVLVIDLIVSKC